MKGKIPDNMLGPVIDSLPVELTLIDTDNKYVMWSQLKQEVFHRSDDILGKDVMVCHPKESHAKIKKLLAGMKSGEIDNQVMIIDCKGPDGSPAKVRIEYLALRDSQGKYLGCLELCNYV
ncbi:MAG: PAS domain-containing protein [Thermoplasmata archaeon]|nr:PAS domain-containing protein [Thermoplasmata archaeon]